MLCWCLVKSAIGAIEQGFQQLFRYTASSTCKLSLLLATKMQIELFSAHFCQWTGHIWAHPSWPGHTGLFVVDEAGWAVDVSVLIQCTLYISDKLIKLASKQATLCDQYCLFYCTAQLAQHTQHSLGAGWWSRARADLLKTTQTCETSDLHRARVFPRCCSLLDEPFIDFGVSIFSRSSTHTDTQTGTQTNTVFAYLHVNGNWRTSRSFSLAFYLSAEQIDLLGHNLGGTLANELPLSLQFAAALAV